MADQFTYSTVHTHCYHSSLLTRFHSFIARTGGFFGILYVAMSLQIASLFDTFMLSLGGFVQLTSAVEVPRHSEKKNLSMIPFTPVHACKAT